MDESVKSEKSKQPAVALVPWNPWLGVVLIIITYYVSQLFGGLVVSIYPYLHGWSRIQANNWLTNSTFAQFFYVLLAEVSILAVLYLFLKRYKCNFVAIGLKKPRWRDVGFGLLIAPAYYLTYLILLAAVSHFVPGLNVDQHQDIGFTDVHGVVALSLTFISLVVLPPLTEEIMVRGFLYSSLKKALPTLWAVLLTSLIFAAAHLPEGGAAGPLYVAAIDTFVLSLFLIFLRERTGSLTASITLHGTKNFIAFLSLFVWHVH